MLKKTITTKLKDGNTVKREIKHLYFVPETLEEACAVDGESMVFQEYLKGRQVTYRNGEVKPLMKLDGDDHISDKKIIETIANFAETWTPTQAKTADPKKRVQNAALKTAEAGRSIEEQIADLQELKALKDDMGK
tara:strand:- start:407 stop:811 length:405 start_codon:yes stop_codon:yes gene_type:complete